MVVLPLLALAGLLTDGRIRTAVVILIVLLPAMRPPLHLGLRDLVAGTIVTATRSPSTEVWFSDWMRV